MLDKTYIHTAAITVLDVRDSETCCESRARSRHVVFLKYMLDATHLHTPVRTAVVTARRRGFPVAPRPRLSPHKVVPRGARDCGDGGGWIVSTVETKREG